MAFALSRTLTVGRPVAYYTSQLQFQVELVPGTCQNHFNKAGDSFELELSAGLKAQLSPYVTAGFKRELESLTEAALRFYVPDVGPGLAGPLYDEALFLLRRDMGLYMAATATGNSIGRAPVGQGMRFHSEADGQLVELLAYGVAIEFMADALQINRDRFYFLTGSKARPDFAAKLSQAELTSLSMAALGTNGAPVSIEVKGRTSDQGSQFKGNDLLVNLAKKCESTASGAFAAVLVNFPKDATAASWPAKIQIYDPGTPQPMRDRQQVAVLLSQILAQSCRFGLWATASACLRAPWLDFLLPLSTDEQRMVEVVRRSAPETQGHLIGRTFGERRYRGRFFYSGLERLGNWHERLLTVDEARAMLAARDFGEKTFRGIDVALEQIVNEGHVSDLVQWGLRDNDHRDTPMSAFVSIPAAPEERALTSQEANVIAGAFTTALREHDGTHHW